MRMLWTRIGGYVGFAVSVAVAVWMQNLGYGWFSTLSTAAIIWLLLPFVVSQIIAIFVLVGMQGRIRRYPSEDLMGKIAEAIKGLPPAEQEAVAKRMIDEALK